MQGDAIDLKHQLADELRRGRTTGESGVRDSFSPLACTTSCFTAQTEPERLQSPRITHELIA
jgi:hypothetical protein